MDVVVRTPQDSARTIALNAVPEVRQALQIMRLPGDVFPGEIVQGHGTVHIALRSSEAYDLARWVRDHCTQEEIRTYAGGDDS
ncbi:hypothetical protein AB0B13_09745 [Streptomyces sp. NPDC042898]|uniref:hypothetical protein n=1 Tax=Streptomyces sp. NPDC042898 TaxID=3154334 RepID=UPI0033F2833B